MEKQVKEFYEKMKDNLEFNQKLLSIKEKYSTIKNPEEQIKIIIKEFIIPFAQKHGYDFSFQELLDFEEKSKKRNIVPLDDDVLEDVSGGFSPQFNALCLTALLGVFGGFAAVTANAEGETNSSEVPAPVVTMQNSSSTNENSADEKRQTFIQSEVQKVLERCKTIADYDRELRDLESLSDARKTFDEDLILAQKNALLEKKDQLQKQEEQERKLREEQQRQEETRRKAEEQARKAQEERASRVNNYVTSHVEKLKNSAALGKEINNLQNELNDIDSKVQQAASTEKFRQANEQRNKARNWFKNHQINWGGNTDPSARNFLSVSEAKEAYGQIIGQLNEIKRLKDNEVKIQKEKEEKERRRAKAEAEQQRLAEEQRKEIEKQKAIDKAYKQVDFHESIIDAKLEQGNLTINVNDYLEQVKLDNKKIKSILDKFKLDNETPKTITFSGTNMWEFKVRRGDYQGTLRVFDNEDNVFTSISIPSSFNSKTNLIVDFEGNIHAKDSSGKELSTITLGVSDFNSIKETYPNIDLLTPGEGVSSLKMQTSTGDILQKRQGGYVYLYNTSSNKGVNLNENDMELFKLLGAKDGKIWLVDRSLNVTAPENVIAKPRLLSSFFSSASKQNMDRIKQELVKERINITDCAQDFTSGYSILISNSAKLDNIKEYSKELQQILKEEMIKSLLNSQDDSLKKYMDEIQAILYSSDKTQKVINYDAIKNLAKNATFRTGMWKNSKPYVLVPIYTTEKNSSNNNAAASLAVSAATMNIYADNSVAQLKWNNQDPNHIVFQKPKNFPTVSVSNAYNLFNKEIQQSTSNTTTLIEID